MKEVYYIAGSQDLFKPVLLNRLRSASGKLRVLRRVQIEKKLVLSNLGLSSGRKRKKSLSKTKRALKALLLRIQMVLAAVN